MHCTPSERSLSKSSFSPFQDCRRFFECNFLHAAYEQNTNPVYDCLFCHTVLKRQIELVDIVYFETSPSDYHVKKKH